MTSIIDERKKVWLVFSDLFLDADVRRSHPAIIRTCVESPFSVAELHFILVDEVAPVCAPNLLSVAGQWSGFDEQWLVSSITLHLKKRRSVFSAVLKPIQQFFTSGYINKQWAAIEPEIIRQKGEPDQPV